MRYAIIVNGEVSNIIEADRDFASQIGGIDIGSSNVSISDSFDGQKFLRVIDGVPEVIFEVPIEEEITLEDLQLKIKNLENQLSLTEDALNFLIMNGGVMDA